MAQAEQLGRPARAYHNRMMDYAPGPDVIEEYARRMERLPEAPPMAEGQNSQDRINAGFMELLKHLGVPPVDLPPEILYGRKDGPDLGESLMPMEK